MKPSKIPFEARIPLMSKFYKTSVIKDTYFFYDIQCKKKPVKIMLVTKAH